MHLAWHVAYKIMVAYHYTSRRINSYHCKIASLLHAGGLSVGPGKGVGQQVYIFFLQGY